MKLEEYINLQQMSEEDYSKYVYESQKSGKKFIWRGIPDIIPSLQIVYGYNMYIIWEDEKWRLALLAMAPKWKPGGRPIYCSEEEFLGQLDKTDIPKEMIEQFKREYKKKNLYQSL